RGARRLRRRYGGNRYAARGGAWACGPLQAIQDESASPLEDGEVVVGHLQDQAGHGGAVFRADRRVGPAAVGELAPQQFVADGGVPAIPVGAAGVPHRLHRIVVPVEVVVLVAKDVSLGQV